MKLSLLRKYLIISLGFTVLFLVVSFLLLQLYFEARRKNLELNPPAFNQWIFNSSGKILESSTNDPPPIQLNKIHLPVSGQATVSFDRHLWPHRPPIFIIKLLNEHNRFAVFAPAPQPSKGHAPPRPRHHPFLLPIVVIVAAILLGSTSSVIVLLKKLFDELKLKEKSRTRTLQELAHDLRTPIASMQNNLSLLSGEQGAIAETLKYELMATSKKEADYIEKLVNDLLMLSQLTADDSPTARTPVDLAELIEDELDILTTNRQKPPIRIHIEAPSQPAIILGNTLLLKRLFRNIIQNALDFARAEITIHFVVEQSTSAQRQVKVTINDDGPGFSADALKDYGERRTTRFIESSHKEGRISVGLGSVIVNAIARLHSARVIPSNRTLDDGAIAGAQVEVIF